MCHPLEWLYRNTLISRDLMLYIWLFTLNDACTLPRTAPIKRAFDKCLQEIVAQDDLDIIQSQTQVVDRSIVLHAYVTNANIVDAILALVEPFDCTGCYCRNCYALKTSVGRRFHIPTQKSPLYCLP